jgi:hemerythrin-like domain-containing protein
MCINAHLGSARDSGVRDTVPEERASMSDRDVAIAIIKAEHRALSAVLHTFQESLSKVTVGHAAPDFPLYSAMLFYIDDFQERCHHPKEDEYLFKVLRATCSDFDDVINELQAGHVGGVHAMAGLHRRLVHFQGGAAGGLDAMKSGIDIYTARMLEHMRREEELLERSMSVISDHGWARIAAAFDKNDDPLFGNNRRDEFTRLYQRIQLLAPRKLKQGQHLAGDVARPA